MDVKLFEIRDRGTMIPAIAVRFGSRTEAERWLMSHAGYGQNNADHASYVMLAKIAGGEMKASVDPYGWPGSTRTMNAAHVHIRKHWESLESGDVICVKFLCGERASPKVSERVIGG